jgi:putative Mg2+ transporter-C (MgtC) family protein
MHILPITILMRIFVALLCGSLLGLERERRERAAGLRTHSLVAIAACMIMIISCFGFSDVLPLDHVGLDPSRVAAQIVSGIGFLGAGVIIFRKNSVQGLTTAASIWASAGVGMASGGGLFWLAFTGTATIIIVQTVYRYLEIRFFPHHQQIVLKLRIKPGEANITEITQLLEGANISVRIINLIKGKNGKADRINVICRRLGAKPRSELLDQLRQIQGVEGLKSQFR